MNINEGEAQEILGLFVREEREGRRAPLQELSSGLVTQKTKLGETKCVCRATLAGSLKTSKMQDSGECLQAGGGRQLGSGTVVHLDDFRQMLKRQGPGKSR